MALIAPVRQAEGGIEEAGENPALYPKLYVPEAASRGVSRSLGKPEKAGRRTWASPAGDVRIARARRLIGVRFSGPVCCMYRPDGALRRNSGCGRYDLPQPLFGERGREVPRKAYE